MGFDGKFIKFFFKSEWDNNMMVAFLSNLPFESFEDTSEGIVAYLPEDIYKDDLTEEEKRIVKDIVNNSEEFETKIRIGFLFLEK